MTSDESREVETYLFTTFVVSAGNSSGQVVVERNMAHAIRVYVMISQKLENKQGLVPAAEVVLCCESYN